MAKIKNVPTVTESARKAADALSAIPRHPTAWDAVEASARASLANVEASTASTSFAEFHFTGTRVQGVIKAGDVVLKIES